MFEQTTPQSDCCLESLRLLFLGLSACLAEWSGEMRGKVSQVCQKWSFLFFLYSCGHMLQWWVWSGSLIGLLSSCLITDWTWSCSEVDKKPHLIEGPHETTFGDHRSSSVAKHQLPLRAAAQPWPFLARRSAHDPHATLPSVLTGLLASIMPDRSRHSQRSNRSHFNQ